MTDLSSSSACDTYFMQRALALARSVGAGSRPNPRVGAVLVQGETIIGEGATQAAGRDHAEIVALKEAYAQHGQAAVVGATLYVTLEPCAHFGRTPPCVNALIEARLARVVVATRDPFPQVAGAGIAALRQAGMVLEIGLEEAEARAINAGFMSRIERHKPFVRLKIASSIDGVTALPNGQSQWISGPVSRRDGHYWRAQSCAVLTGIGTVLADDPLLTVRDAPLTLAPERLVIDSQARIPLAAKILQGPPIYLFCAQENSRTAQLRALGHQVWVCPAPEKPNEASPRVDLPAVMQQLAQLGFNEVLVEAGATLSGALLQAGAVDEVLCYLAPKILGQGRGWVNWQLTDLGAGQSLQLQEQIVLGEDLRLRWRCT